MFEGKYGKQFGTMLFCEVCRRSQRGKRGVWSGQFLDWAKHNKRSLKHDQFRVRPLLRAFAGKTLGEITPGAIETFKSIRLHSVTKRKTKRSPASVSHEIDLLSRIFSLAVIWDWPIRTHVVGLPKSNCRTRDTGICYLMRSPGCWPNARASGSTWQQ